MPEKPFRLMMRDMEDSADRYARLATMLSDKLEEAERFLQELPGKVEIEVSDGTGSLEFLRDPKGSTWRLCYSEAGEDDFVTNASVRVKAAAAALLPQLFNELIDTQKRNLDMVEDGLRALASLPFLSGEDGQ